MLGAELWRSFIVQRSHTKTSNVGIIYSNNVMPLCWNKCILMTTSFCLLWLKYFTEALLLRNSQKVENVPMKKYYKIISASQLTKK